MLMQIHNLSRQQIVDHQAILAPDFLAYPGSLSERTHMRRGRSAALEAGPPPSPVWPAGTGSMTGLKKRKNLID